MVDNVEDKLDQGVNIETGLGLGAREIKNVNLFHFKKNYELC